MDLTKEEKIALFSTLSFIVERLSYETKKEKVSRDKRDLDEIVKKLREDKKNGKSK